MNMPNLASCHHFIRSSRVAACFRSAGELAACAAELGNPNPSDFVAASASAPAAPNCFKNDRLVLSFQSMIPPCFSRWTTSQLRVSLTFTKNGQNDVEQL
jgi:hypothetical protein